MGWATSTFRDAYRRGVDDNEEDTLAGDSVAVALRGMLVRARAKPKDLGTWTGTTTELMDALRNAYGFGMQYRGANMPRSPRVLSGRLNQIIPLLRRAGVQIVRSKSGAVQVHHRGGSAHLRLSPLAPTSGAVPSGPTVPAVPAAAPDNVILIGSARARTAKPKPNANGGIMTPADYEIPQGKAAPRDAEGGDDVPPPPPAPGTKRWVL